ncbi:hypothetical protein [Lactobacillus paracollinoides] [Lactiplantibacillus mudanjiangensis]|uniref:hypothetical protein n=1 Tax=Lactiplantibacillus mudanjiangensis TaxID=1296538 RepID=UPI001015AC46|nr:hypothetical protein [Lactobacillus paracollinoides] [Lactiplantibacillus mudanjiangensis]
MKKASSKSRIIGEYATRKVGNSLMLTVPVSAGVTDNTKFILRKKADGTLEYQPVSRDDNPWTNGKYATVDFQKNLELDGNYGLTSSVGKEGVEW